VVVLRGSGVERERGRRARRQRMVVVDFIVAEF
jgi:hypothetical protein